VPDRLGIELETLARATADAVKISFMTARQLDDPKHRHPELSVAAKLAHTMATLVQAYDRHTGRAATQVVRIERVTVASGGQAIGGIAGQGGAQREGGGDVRDQQRALAQAADAPLAPLQGEVSADRVAVPGTCDGQGPLPDVRRCAGVRRPVR
jgi:hypothetical protein